MCESNFLYNVNKYATPIHSLTQNDDWTISAKINNYKRCSHSFRTISVIYSWNKMRKEEFMQWTWQRLDASQKSFCPFALDESYFRIGRVIGLRQTVLAICQNYTFDGVFRYKSSSMLIHLYIGWALVHGWMTRLILMRIGILGHFMPKITIKACFLEFPSRKVIFRDRNTKLATNVFKRMLSIWEYVASKWLLGTPRCEWFLGGNHQRWVIFVISHN